MQVRIFVFVSFSGFGVKLKICFDIFFCGFAVNLRIVFFTGLAMRVGFFSMFFCCGYAANLRIVFIVFFTGLAMHVIRTRSLQISSFTPKKHFGLHTKRSSFLRRHQRGHG